MSRQHTGELDMRESIAGALADARQRGSRFPPTTATCPTSCTLRSLHSMPAGCPLGVLPPTS